MSTFVRSVPVFVLVAALCGGCASSGPNWTAPDVPASRADGVEMWPRPPAGAEARRAFDDAVRLEGLGRVGEAVTSVVAALDADPEFLEAHRLLQDLAIRTTADWWLRERYERFLAERPDDADANYLLARIEPDAERQLELFTRATSIDPRHPYARLGRAIALARRGDVAGALVEARRSTELAPWLPLPWIWLGTESLKRGEPAAAARFFGAARDRVAADARPWLGLAQASAALGDAAESSRNALEALRLAPGDEAISSGAADAMARAGVPSDLEAAVGVIESAARNGAGATTCDLARARLCAALGRHADAVDALLRATQTGISAADVAQPLRTSRVLSGRFREAVDGAIAALPRAAFASSNLYAPRWNRLRAAAAAAESRDPRALLELAEAMASVGWLDESRAVLVAARAASPGDPVIAVRAAGEEAFAAFVEDLGRIARESRDGARDPSSRPTVESVLARVADASKRRLATDVTDGAVVRSYPLLGTFAVSVVSGGAFETSFGSHGLACLVGARSGGAVELVLGRLVVVRSGTEDSVLGEPIGCDECWLESEGLPADVAGLRRGLAGLTLDRLVLLQLDAIVRAPRPPAAGLPFVRRPAPTRAERRSLDTPSDVAERIEARLLAEGRIDGAVLDAVRRHELVHVYDAARLLPITSHPFRALAFAIANGLSGVSTERALEARAQAISLVSVREPRLALAALVAFLPARDGETPHTAAYREVTQAAVDLIIGDPGAFPSIDPRWNVLQQFDALSDDEVRDLGRRLAELF